MATAILELTDRSPMPFGKYIGKPMAQIPAQYLLWLYNKGCDNYAVKKYIINNLSVLEQEVKRK